MSLKKVLTTNSLAAAIEFVVEVLVSFFIYRYIIKNLGISALGVWALAISFTSLTSIGSSGFASSTVKFVSKYFYYNDLPKVSRVITTIAISVFVLSLVLALLVKLFLAFNYEWILSYDEYKMLSGILTLVFTSFIITSVARVFLSSIDGLNLIYLRSRIGITSKLIYAAANIVLIPLYGLKGLAAAQVILGISLLVLSIRMLSDKINILEHGGRKFFDYSVFKEIFSYGAYFQLSSILQFLSDPLTRFFLKDIGGLSAVGLFEAIYKLFFQFRQLIVVVLNTHVPLVAARYEMDKSHIRSIYLPFFGKAMVMALFGMTLIFPFMTVIFRFFNISFNDLSITYVAMMSIGLYINLLAASCYIFNLGTGHIKTNTTSTGIFALVNIAGCYFLGKAFGVSGVAAGWMCAHIASSLFLLVVFMKKQKISFAELFTTKELILHVIFVFCLSVIIELQQHFTALPSLLLSLFIYIMFAVLFIMGSKKFKEISPKLFSLKQLLMK